MKVNRVIICMLFLLGCGDNPGDLPPRGLEPWPGDAKGCEVFRSDTLGGVLVCPRAGGFYCEPDHEVRSEVE